MVTPPLQIVIEFVEPPACLGSVTGASMMIAVRLLRREQVESFLLMTDDRSGFAPLRFAFTPVRVVCSNTLRSAMFGAGAEVKRRAFRSALDLV
jgi:hypothetical protein